MIQRATWIRIIKDFEEMELPQLVEREIMTSSGTNVVDLVKNLPIRRAISIIGPRRVGKTFFMFQLIRALLHEGIPKERILYVNLESDLLIGCTVTDLRQMLDLHREMHSERVNETLYLFLDEIQNVPSWERFVRGMLDAENVQVVISGSSSKLLSREIATSLRGRTLSYRIHPFSFKEYLKAKSFPVTPYLSSSQKARLLNLLSGYVKTSYPETILLERETRRILTEILDVTIYRDIIERYNIKNVKVLRLLLKGMAQSLYFSVHKFYNYLKSMGFKIGKNTLYEYIDHLQDAMIIHTLKKFSTSYKDIEQTIPKVYFIDNGLLGLYGVENLGRYLENVVFVELLRREYQPNEQLFYYLSNNKEVDFVIKEGDDIAQLIQVTHSLDSPATKERELKALIKASNELNCKNLLVITWDQDATTEYKGHDIKITSSWRWLLDM